MFIVVNTPDIPSECLIAVDTLEVHRLSYGGDDEKAFIAYQSDPEIYDSGLSLTVVYQRNKSHPNAVENNIIDMDPLTGDKEHAIYLIVKDFLPTIRSQFCPTITRITLETVQGELAATVSEDVEEIRHYLPIPSHLSHVFTVPIHELRKVTELSVYVHLVTWLGKKFAFKVAEDSLEGTVQEINILDKLRASPGIIDLEAIVTDKDDRIRGFLMPYMKAGDLGDIFVKARRSEGRADDDRSEPIFDWRLKLSWAHQITRGVVELHSIGAYNGDLKPSNILLDASANAILIDFLPVGITQGFAAPEVLVKWRNSNCNDHVASVLTPEADIYSLGLTLYAIAQEISSGEEVQPPEWSIVTIPMWYRGVVQRCLAVNPGDRPSATEVLTLLEEGS